MWSAPPSWTPECLHSSLQELLQLSHSRMRAGGVDGACSRGSSQRTDVLRTKSPSGQGLQPNTAQLPPWCLLHATLLPAFPSKPGKNCTAPGCQHTQDPSDLEISFSVKSLQCAARSTNTHRSSPCTASPTAHTGAELPWHRAAHSLCSLTHYKKSVYCSNTVERHRNLLQALLCPSSVCFPASLTLCSEFLYSLVYSFLMFKVYFEHIQT